VHQALHKEKAMLIDFKSIARNLALGAQSRRHQAKFNFISQFEPLTAFASML